MGHDGDFGCCDTQPAFERGRAFERRDVARELTDLYQTAGPVTRGAIVALGKRLGLTATETITFTA